MDLNASLINSNKILLLTLWGIISFVWPTRIWPTLISNDASFGMIKMPQDYGNH